MTKENIINTIEQLDQMHLVSPHVRFEIMKILLGELIEIDDSERISITYLRLKFPKLTSDLAEKFLDYCHKKTIYRKECFGDGKAMFESWIKDEWL